MPYNNIICAVASPVKPTETPTGLEKANRSIKVENLLTSDIAPYLMPFERVPQPLGWGTAIRLRLYMPCTKCLMPIA